MEKQKAISLPQLSARPLVSVITIVKNRENCIKRCMDSLLRLRYDNLEFIVQDGASTDGTLDILQGYSCRRMKLESRQDTGPQAALERAVHRVSGEIVCFCASDDELLPDAVADVVEAFHANPDVGVIYGDVYRTDINGVITDTARFGPWDYKRYFCDEMHILIPSSFIRKLCLDELAFIGRGEYEIFTQIGARHPFLYLPKALAHFACHQEMSSRDITVLTEEGKKRINMVRHLCGKQDTPEHIRRLRDKAVAIIFCSQVKQFFDVGRPDIADQYLIEALQCMPELPKKRDEFLAQVRLATMDKKIFIYGAGEHTKALLADIDFQENGTTILGILDSEPLKWGKEFHGYTVHSPEILAGRNASVLISSFVAQVPMQDVVEGYGCRAITLYDINDYENTIDFVYLHTINKQISHAAPTGNYPEV